MDPKAPSILFLNHNLAGQATYFRNINFARGLAARGWNATLMTVAPQQRLTVRSYEDAGIRVIETPWLLPSPFWAGNGFDPLDILFRCLWCMTHRFDVTVVSDHLLNVSLPYFASRLSRGSTLYVADWADLFSRGGCHAAFQHGLGRPLHAVSAWLELGTKRWCDLATATSRPLQNLLLEYCGKTHNRTLHLPSGSNPAVAYEETTNAARQRYDFARSDLVIGRTGRTGKAGALHPHEQEAFLAIHRFLLSRGLPAPVLYLVGDHQAEWYPKLTEAGCRLRISGLLPSAQVPEHLRVCDLFILVEADNPFNRHRGPIRLNDYLVVGRPILCNSIGDHTQTLTEARAGVVWDDLATVPPAVQHVLLDPATRLAMGRNARHLAEGELSWARLCERLEAFILDHDPQLRRHDLSRATTAR
jgi:glycosyltransferase involved in cell wall biosynthesis